MWIAGDRCTGLGRNPSHVLLWARRSPPGSRYVRAAIPLVRMKQCPERRCVNLASVKVAIRGITPGWPGRLRAPHLLRHWSFLRGINLLFPRKRRTGYIFSGTRLCNRRHRRCRRVFAPRPLPPSPARRHPDSPGRLHSLLLGKTRASSAPVLGWRKRIDPCLSPPPPSALEGPRSTTFHAASF